MSYCPNRMSGSIFKWKLKFCLEGSLTLRRFQTFHFLLVNTVRYMAAREQFETTNGSAEGVVSERS